NRTHPDRPVRVRGISHLELPAAVAKAVADGNPPDVAEYYCSTEQLALDTYTPDGRPYFGTIGAALRGRPRVLDVPVVVGDLEPQVRNYFSRDTLLSMPVTVTTPLLYSNATLLRRAGISAPPRTWAELEHAAQ